MKTFIVSFILIIIACMFLYTGVFAEPDQKEPDGASEKAEETPLREHNFEFVIHNNTDTELTSWVGQIFSLNNAKLIATLSPKDRVTQLPAGNYVFMFSFEEEILPELNGHRPFTFTITENAKTHFTLFIGTSQEPEIEYGVSRAGADFVDSDPRSGRDYVNVELPIPDPELCLAKCKKDPNCDAYSYGTRPEWPKARCWLIHGAAAVTEKSPYSVSGVITRDSSPYRVEILTETLEPKE
jgi:hypothetical protein